jgi:replicative DNA helicase
MKKLRFLPHNLLAEKAVIAIIINYSNATNFVIQVLPIEAFYIEIYQIIYKAAIAINNNQTIVDLITITTWLQDNNLLEKIGGLKPLIQLSEKIVSLINLKYYIELIKEKYIRRLLINFGKDIIKLSFQTNLPTKIIFNKINKEIFNLIYKTSFNNISNTSEILTDIFSNLEKNKNNLFGYSSRFVDLDAILQGFQKSDLIIIAGRPSIGKTAFSLNLALDICLNYNLPVIFFSLEMTKYQLVYRLLSIKTEIITSRLKLGNFTQAEWIKLNQELKYLSSLPFYIDDSSNISLTEIELKIQKIKLQFGSIGLIIIDYLQLINNNIKSENRVQEISQITRSLKKFAKEFDVPIIVLSQLSRNVESRTNKRPILSDLRESGCVHLKNKQFFNYNNNKNFYKISSLLRLQLKNYFQFNCQFTGFKPVFQIQTKFNSFVLTTSNHKFLNYEFWLKLNNLSKNLLIKVNFYIFFSKLFHTTILNEKIKSIKYKRVKTVYDFELLNNKNFLKNSFILHNSIEQDADIVLMLYRDDYYNNQIKEKSIVEILISKHRNGPTGIVKLYFDNYLTKFSNYS